MKRRKLIPNNENVRREQDPIPWRYCLLTLVCGLLLVVGFFWAARLHFSAMDFGIKNAKLRQQKEELETEQRLLDRSKEIALTPAEIKRVAKKIGLRDLTAQSIEVISSIKDSIIPQNKTNKDVSKQSLATKTEKTEKNENTKNSVEKKIEDKSFDAKPKPQTSSSDLQQKTVKK